MLPSQHFHPSRKLTYSWILLQRLDYNQNSNQNVNIVFWLFPQPQYIVTILHLNFDCTLLVYTYMCIPLIYIYIYISLTSQAKSNSFVYFPCTSLYICIYQKIKKFWDQHVHTQWCLHILNFFFLWKLFTKFDSGLLVLQAHQRFYY